VGTKIHSIPRCLTKLHDQSRATERCCHRREVQGRDKLWAPHSRLGVPLAHVRAVHADASPKMGWSQGLKVFGAGLPNVSRAGTFSQDGGWVFRDVRHPDKVIVVELCDERPQRLVVEVADPAAEVDRLQRAVAAGRA
jgi:hypothetical protein